MKMRYYHGGESPPVRGTEESAGLDIYHCGEDTTMYPGTRFDAKTDLCVEIPEGHVGLIVPRSGLGRKGLVLVNAVGVIVSDYRGVLGMTLPYPGGRAGSACAWRQGRTDADYAVCKSADGAGGRCVGVE